MTSQNLIGEKFWSSWGFAEQISKSPSRRGLQWNHAQLQKMDFFMIKSKKSLSFFLLYINSQQLLIHKMSYFWLKSLQWGLNLDLKFSESWSKNSLEERNFSCSTSKTRFFYEIFFFTETSDFRLKKFKNSQYPKMVSKRLYGHYLRSYEQFWVFQKIKNRIYHCKIEKTMISQCIFGFK